jgi:hypothetical protein
MGHRPVEHSFDIWHLIKVFFVDVYSSIYRSICYVLLAPLTIEIQVVSFFADVSTVGAGVLDVYSIFVEPVSDLDPVWVQALILVFLAGCQGYGSVLDQLSKLN